MTIQSARLARDIETIAAFNPAAPETGYSRPTFSPAWQQARDYVIAEARAAGCNIHIDASGNVHARPAALPANQPLWLCGSHIDSVPTGGKFDGVLGVVAPLEVLRCHPTAPLELIIFAEEEGTTFNLGMLGSRAWAGTLGINQLTNLHNSAGQNYLQAGTPFGVNPDRLLAERLNPSDYLGLIELHIEQGPAMWNKNIPLAVVTAINGRRQFTCIITGVANHAGSTQMADRSDALAAAAEMLLGLESLGEDLDHQLAHTVITVGRITVEPNALNVIPGRVTFSVDFRAKSNAMLDAGQELITSLISSICESRDIHGVLSCTEKLPALPMSGQVCQRLREAAERLGLGPLPDVASGALHDSAILAPLLPTAMLFVASQGGISHNPQEFSRLEDITAATQILAEAVLHA